MLTPTMGDYVDAMAGRDEPHPESGSGALSLRVQCPRCGRAVLDAPYQWGYVVVRELADATDAQPEEGVTRCAHRECRAWVGFTFSRKAA